MEGVWTASVSGNCPRLVPFKAADYVEAPKRVTSVAQDAVDARFKTVRMAALIQHLLLLISLSLGLNLLHLFLSKLNRLQPSATIAIPPLSKAPPYFPVCVHPHNMYEQSSNTTLSSPHVHGTENTHYIPPSPKGAGVTGVSRSNSCNPTLL